VLITTSQGKLTAIYPALLAVINNIAAYLEGLNASTCSRIMQLFNSMSSPSFLLANETNHGLLGSLLEAINAIVEHQYSSESSSTTLQAAVDADYLAENPHFIFAILRNRKRFEALRSLTLESGQEEIERRSRRRKDSGASHDPLEPNSTRSSMESIRSPTASRPQAPTLGDVPEEDNTFAIGDDDDDSDDDDARPTPATSSPSDNPSVASSVASAADDDVPRQLQGMSEKARGKMPAGVGNFSRQNSTTSLGSPVAPSQSYSGMFEPSAHWIDSWLPELPLHTTLTVLQQLSVLVPRQALTSDTPTPATLGKIREVQLVGIEPSPVRVHSFEWSPLALGWYESLLWGFIFTSEMQVSKGTVGVWNTTNIKLFRVQETAAQGPSLTSPRGAVDAVGSNIVSRIGAMNLRGVGNPSAPALGNGQPPPRGS
jgi:hypothetical protein